MDIKKTRNVIEMGPDFKGVEYVEVANRPHHPLNMKLVQKQLDILEKEHRWASDKELENK
jgi:hypothetical protein